MMKKLIILMISLFTFVNLGVFVSDANAQSVPKTAAKPKPKAKPKKGPKPAPRFTNLPKVEDKKCAEIIMDSDGVLNTDWIEELIQSKYNINNCNVYRTIHKDEWDEPKYIQILDESSFDDDDGYEEDESKYEKKILSRAIHLVDQLSDYEKLIDAGANVNLTDERGQTIFFNTKIFADEEDVEVYDIFNNAKVNVNIKDNSRQTALSMAIPKMLMNVYSWKEDGTISAQDVNDEEGSNYTKNFSGHLNYIRWLLKRGATVKGGNAKINALLKLKPEKFVKEIVKVGLDINSLDVDGYTALHKLVRHKVPDMPAKQSKLYKDRYVNTELYDPIKLLLDSGASPNVRDAMGRTPLHYAQNPHVIQALLKAGAEINETDNEGRTPLHLAVTENVSSFDELLKACPNATIKDKSGKTALDLATLDWHKEGLELYNKIGCKAYKKARANDTSSVRRHDDD